MFNFWVLILFFAYLSFVRRNETVEERRIRGSFFEIFPHKKNGMWRWEKYWWIEASCYVLVMVLGSIILINI